MLVIIIKAFECWDISVLGITYRHSSGRARSTGRFNFHFYSLKHSLMAKKLQNSPFRTTLTAFPLSPAVIQYRGYSK